MTSLSRRLVTFLLLWMVLVAIGGCTASRPGDRGEAATLEDMSTAVPKLAGLELKKAQTVLTFVALRIGEVNLYDTDDPSLHGKVYEQDPAPGTAVRGGTHVNVKVYRYVAPVSEGASEEEK
jgi:beta-lactam-binding protein with PASTA domain